MAISLSLDSLYAPSVAAPSPSCSSTPIKSLTFPRCPTPRPSSPLKLILVSSLSRGSPFTIFDERREKAATSTVLASGSDSSPRTSQEEEGHQKDNDASKADSDNRYPSDLKTLIKIYNEALAHGDEITVSEIEVVIRSIEMKKNELGLKVLTLLGEIASAKDNYIRLQADFDNFRKKFDKDRVKMQSNARGVVIESLLPLIDSFEGARKQLKPETEKEKKIDTSYQGIYRQFVEVMRSLNVSAIATVGKPFDPSLHEAISREESQDFREGIVVKELQRGFLLGDKVLRPAKVKVSSGPASRKAPSSSEQSATAAGRIDDR